ncbi:DUF4129 domain-containing protein [Chitinophaga sp. G-6-1-13]|uniref:DUF4129 domain-containing protein n=1 Tax=Chitinophaga fulva TaxID=2728842 RepID=A0A848GXK3_9BACT|nr:DUF4129 domain-containing protein [Chitinophaga fulva]NML41450.1 DUF4129 domain-containing protein [Chitinophaga fulva]
MMKRVYRKYGWLLLLCLSSVPLTGISQSVPPPPPEPPPAITVSAEDTSALTSPVETATEEESTQEQAAPILDEYGEEVELPPFDKRAVHENTMRGLKADDDMQYRDKPSEDTQTTSKFGEGVARFFAMIFYALWQFSWVILILLLAGLGYLLYRFMKNNDLSIFRKPKLVDGLEEIQEENLQSAAEYEEKIRAAIAAGEIRQAIRWWYLYTLFQLANRQLITPGREKTNNDYLRSMRNTPYYKTFSTLTLDYEYIWYGGFEISADNFRTMDQQFRDFNNQLGKAS